MSGTPFCMLPVTSLNRSKIGNGKPGEIFTSLINQWSKNVGLDIKEQIKSWDKKFKNNNKSAAPTPYEFK